MTLKKGPDIESTVRAGMDEAYEIGRQAQYKLHRAGNCEHCFNGRCAAMAVPQKIEPCPTDYKKCPLKEPKE